MTSFPSPVFSLIHTDLLSRRHELADADPMAPIGMAGVDAPCDVTALIYLRLCVVAKVPRYSLCRSSVAAHYANGKRTYPFSRKKRKSRPRPRRNLSLCPRPCLRPSPSPSPSPCLCPGSSPSPCRLAWLNRARVA